MSSLPYPLTRTRHRQAPGRVSEVLGWYGTLAIVGAYALVSLKLTSSDGSLFQALNLTGALGIIAISLKKGVRQSIALNAFWALIAVVALLRAFV